MKQLEYQGKLIHCAGITRCKEPNEPGYIEENGIDVISFKNIFFKDFGLEYIVDYALKNNIHFHIATHSIATSRCYEKAKITGLPLERVIKGFYLEDSKREVTYALAIPGDKTYEQEKIADLLKISQDETKTRIITAWKEFLPLHIEFGTVHPFVNEDSFYPNGRLEFILFDKSFLEKRKLENGLDDFSFTVHPSTGYDNHRLSIQINYFHAFEILKNKFGKEKVKAVNLVNV